MQEKREEQNSHHLSLKTPLSTYTKARGFILFYINLLVYKLSDF